MPEDSFVPETSFVLAAEKAIKDLQVTAESQRLTLEAQQVALEKANKSANWRKIQLRILGLVSVVLVVVCLLGTMQYFHTRDIATKVQQGSISQCLDTNHVRADDIKIWNTFVGILEGSHPTQPVQSEALAFEQFIAKVYAPRDCTALFGSPNADSPASAG